MKLVFLIILVFSINQYVFSQTKIITIRDNQLIGMITEETELEIKLKTLSGENITVPKSLVKSKELLTSEIRVKSGLSMKGTLQSLSETHCKFLSNDSIHATVKYDNLEFFKIDDIEIQKFINSRIKIRFENKEPNIPAEIESTEISTSYSKYGLALLTPGGINLLFGYSYSDLCFHICIGGYEGFYGLQTGPGVNLYSSKSVEHNVLFVVGLVKGAKVHDYEYYGPVWEFNVSGFHFQAGIAFGSGKPRPLAQLGYAYRIGN